MQSITLSAPWRKLLLTVHVAATVSVLGTDLVLLLLGLSSLSGTDPRTIYPAAHLVGARLVAPLAVLSLSHRFLATMPRRSSAQRSPSTTSTAWSMYSWAIPSFLCPRL
jgi:hypothetical protein